MDVELEKYSTDEYSLFAMGTTGRVKPLLVSVKVDGRQLIMEVDTGASVSLISESTFRKYWPNRKLQHTSIVLRTFTKEALKTLGKFTVSVVYKEQVCDDLLLVVPGDGPTLLGRDWLERIRLDWHNLYQVRPQSLVEEVLLDYEQLFKESWGTLNRY